MILPMLLLATIATTQEPSAAAAPRTRTSRRLLPARTAGSRRGADLGNATAWA